MPKCVESIVIAKDLAGHVQLSVSLEKEGDGSVRAELNAVGGVGDIPID